jgi:hypothetical protein
MVEILDSKCALCIAHHMTYLGFQYNIKVLVHVRQFAAYITYNLNLVKQVLFFAESLFLDLVSREGYFLSNLPIKLCLDTFKSETYYRMEGVYYKSTKSECNFICILCYKKKTGRSVDRVYSGEQHTISNI